MNLPSYFSINFPIGEKHYKKNSNLFCVRFFCIAITLFTLSLFPNLSKGQGASQYSFTSIRGAFSAISGSPINMTTVDDDFANGFPIGFNFTFGGTVYTQFNVSTNGWITFGTAGTPNNLTNSGLTNSFNALPQSPVIAPLWDDIAITTGNDLTGGTPDISYSLSGSSPTRQLTIQYENVNWNWLSTSPALKFQIILYEGTNVIDFVYDQISTSINAPSASIGIATASGNYLSLSSSSASASASSSINTTNINALPDAGQIFRFTPPPLCNAAPDPGATSASLTSICAGSGGTTVLSIPVLSFSGLSYQWQSSTDNVTWTSNGPTTATWTATPVATTYYRCQVTCDNRAAVGYSTSVQVVYDLSCILMPAGTSSASQCGGTFYDSGGPLTNYKNNESNTFTIYPSTPGSAVKVVFTSFNTESGYDGLLIYDGNSTAAPLIPSGLPGGTFGAATCPPDSYYGTNSPGTITSSAADGSLTFVFMSDFIITGSGWTANISCIPPCSGTPNPDSTLSSQAFVCSGYSTILSLKNNYSGLTYDWQSSPDNITYTSVGATTATYSPVLSANTWFHCVVTCTDGGRSATSIPVLVSSSACNEIVMPADTTVITSTTCAGLFVDNGGVRSNYTDNASGTVTIFPAVAGRKVRASFVSFSTENRYDGLMIYNGNSTAAPLISSGLPAGTNAVTAPTGSYYGNTSPGTITSTALDGSLTFVFKSDFSVTQSGWEAIISCYDANICTGTPAPGNTIASSSTICYGASSSLTLQNATAGTGVTYQWQSSVDNTTWVNASGNSTLATYLAQPIVSTYFKCRVTCGGNNGTSTAIRVIVDPTCINMPDTGSISTCSATFYDAGGSANNYNDNESQTFTIRPSSASSLIKVVFSTFSLEQNDTLKIYNGIGTTTLIGSYVTSPGTIISTNATNGALTFVFISNSSINDIGWSATVSCVPNTICSGLPVPGTTVASADTVCTNSVVGLSLSSTLGLGINYQWQESNDNTTFTNIATSVANPSTNSSYIATITSTKWYRCNVNCQGGTNVASTSVKITAVTKPVIQSSSMVGYICTSGTASLIAAAPTGTIKWYTVASGGVSIASGSPYTTPSINITTTYYVGSSLGDCQSDRVAVEALVSPVPSSITVSPSTASICANPNITEIAATGGLYPDGTEAPVTWSPVTYLYIDAAATIAYTANANVRSVYCMPPVSANNTSITYTATVGSVCTRTATSSITITDIRPDITIYLYKPTPPATICSSDTIEFRTTPSPSSLGAQAGYKWFVNNSPLSGTASTAYNIVKFPGTFPGHPTLSDGDSIYCIMYVSPTAIICTASRLDTSNKIRLSITTSVRDSVLLSGPTTICSGQSATYTASPYSNQGLFPTYQFFKNGVSQGAASGTTTFTTSSLVNNDVITVKMVSSASCAIPVPAVSLAKTVTVTPNVTPAFTQVSPICLGSTFTLPTTSSVASGSITGTWTPTKDTTQTTTYTFIHNNSNQCATDTTKMTVVVNASVVTPTFTQVAAICKGGSFTLPTVSNNLYSGTWTPSINNTTTTTYKFTPTAGQCADTAVMTVTVNQKPSASISSNNGPVCSSANGQFFITGTANCVLTYNINSGTNTTVTLSSTGAATITVPNITGSTTLNLISATLNSCDSTFPGPIPTSTIGVVSTSPGGPLSGRYLIPITDLACNGSGIRGFNNIKQAIDSLNLRGVSSNVYFDIKPGYSETITARLIIGSATLYSGTYSTSSIRTVTFRKNPDSTGVNPKVISYTGGTGTPASATPDGIIAIRGTDYITFDGLDLEENSANSGNALMEYGYGLFKYNTSNGAQYNTINNCAHTSKP